MFEVLESAWVFVPILPPMCVQDGNTFCTSLTPRLFSIDLSIPEHKVFFNEVGLGVGQGVGVGWLGGGAGGRGGVGRGGVGRGWGGG